MAFLYENRSYTYDQFNKTVNKLANGLQDLGVKKNDKVSLFMKNSDYFVITYFAIAKLGAIVVPINFNLLHNEIAYILDNSDSTHLIFDSEFEDEIKKVVINGSRLENIISVPNSKQSVFKSFTDVLSSNDSNLNLEIKLTDELQIMYTSGTTGNPKGAVFDHKRVKYTVLQLINSLGYHPEERWSHFAPFFHCAQLMICLVSQIYIGGFGVIYREFEPKRILGDIKKYKITTLLGVPTMYIAFLNVKKEDYFDFSSMDKFLYGAAPMSRETVIKSIEYFGTNKFYSLCGQTETGPTGIILYPEEHENKAGMSGKSSLIYTLIDVVDDEGESVEVGETGELIVKAPSIMKEYYKNPEETTKTIKDGWLYSGDLAIRDEDDYILLVDRKSDMIISGGENVHSIEVENVINNHPGVDDVAVVGVPDDKWGEKVVAFIVRKAHVKITEEDIIKYAKENLARYKCPKEVIFKDALPRNASGKLMKFKIRNQYLNV